MKIAFIGHRHIERTEALKEKLTQLAEVLIVEYNADIFLFGSKSEFNDLCYEVITDLKDKYKYIQRIYVRAEYEYVDEFYIKYLLSLYEDTFYPSQACGAGKLSYVKRNQVMIDMCEVLVTYFDNRLKNRTGGTKIAVAYAYRRKKSVINLFENDTTVLRNER